MVRELVSLGLAAAGGTLVAASFLRFWLWPLAWVAFVPVILAITRTQTTRGAIRVGLAAGLATNVPAFHWLVGTIHSFGGFPQPIAILFYAILSLYSSLELVCFALLVRRTGIGPFAVVPALTWVSLEFLYPNLFPWRLANSQLQVTPLLQIGEITGPYGLSFVMVWVSSAIASAVVHGPRRSVKALSAASAAGLAVLGFGCLRLPATQQLIEKAPAVSVGIVQGNLSVEEKGDVRFFSTNLETYRRLTESIAASADVVIWPETVIGEALPRTLAALPRGARATLGLRRPLLTGALTYEGSPERPLFYNSVMLFDDEGRVLGISDKQILMPFGEYLPFASLFPKLRELSPMTGDFQAGSHVEVLDVPGGGRFAPLNCYEDLRAPIARAATREGRAQVLFAVANDAWFGNTAAPFQHEALAAWRAVENRRYLIRVTNTGVTDVIDATGRVALRLPVFEAASAVAVVRRLDSETFYGRYGDLFAWLTLAAALGAAMRGSRRVDPGA